MSELSAEDLVAGHPGGGAVLRGATLRITAGRRLVLLGANGSGKTTLLRCLSGAHRPLSGRVAVEGTPLRYDRAGLRTHRTRVQLVLQDPDDQLFSADVAQDVSFGPMNLGLPPAEVAARVEEALDLVDAAQLAERPTHRLSYGERKRVATAGAVAMRPRVLLLDEPTAGLDPAGTAAMLAALSRLEEHGTTVALSTHDVDLALAWADEAAVVCAGTVTAGPVGELLDDTALLGRAGLTRPWTLELARRVGLPGRPRTLEAVAQAWTVQERR
ncbi:cobalt/nickel transport system ATP-binding protein [Austwickia chelonae]|uniref:ABC transporter ATP-binding protein n=1 Tax=Austwickia chelonae NBRC 105200 TaxID=1184607 RepID=K6VNZ2_9MICO|nr:ATP-binding cassette domain-containing protein [Austwickia chelonae]GAB77075.1 putative ABC transporter ATP-binding protein [Austwickia chelonae NBRC 105200]SEW33820.1 cobalt/nickel transport system ATP-binding protein [Austwickia chelonae]